MREIKFRAYIKKDCDKELVGKILEVSSLHLKKNKAIIGYSISKSNYGNHSFKYEDIELMQYTGLHDKNGKEIYEGDIIQYGDIHKGIVEYSEKYAQFILKETDNISDEYEALGEFNIIVFEVIGNIYDNKELLNETNR